MEHVMHFENTPFSIVTSEINNKPGYWSYTHVDIFQDDIKIGEYVYNYPSFGKLFYPFLKNEKWYALYSKHYTCTRIMELPSCVDIGGESPHGEGFCPVEYYVPNDAKGNFGFIAGCHWGDDCSYKIQYLDLSECEKGILKRDNRFGYIELPRNANLKHCIDYDYYDENEEHLIIGIAKNFDRKSGKIDE